MSIFSKISRGFKKIVPKNVRAIGRTVLSVVPVVGPAIQAVDRIGRIAQTVKRAIPRTPIKLTSQLSPSTTAQYIQPTAEPLNMSILGALGTLPSIGRAAAGAVIPALGRVGAAGGRLVGAARRFMNTPGGKWTRRAIRDAGLVISGGLVFDAAGNLMGTVARRRMNPLNARALRRSIRRVKSARGICQDIERMLPKKKSSSASCPPFKKRKC